MDYISGPELARRTGASYRQIDYWCRKDVICPVGDARPGSGQNRRFPVTDVPRVKVLAEVSKVFNTKGIGSDNLRKIYQHYPLGSVALSDTITISWRVE